MRSLYVFVLRAEVLTTFGSKVDIFSAHNTKICKICKLRNATFSSFYNISRPNFVILLILKRSIYFSWEISFLLPKLKFSL